MTTRTRSVIGGFLLAAAMGAPLLTPVPACAATRAKRGAASVLSSTIATQASCSAASDDQTGKQQDPKLGTAITWMPTPDAAGRAASDEAKLVFMIQVSGNFAREAFT